MTPATGDSPTAARTALVVKPHSPQCGRAPGRGREAWTRRCRGTTGVCDLDFRFVNQKTGKLDQNI